MIVKDEGDSRINVEVGGAIEGSTEVAVVMVVVFAAAIGHAHPTIDSDHRATSMVVIATSREDEVVEVIGTVEEISAEAVAVVALQVYQHPPAQARVDAAIREAPTDLAEDAIHANGHDRDRTAEVEVRRTIDTAGRADLAPNLRTVVHQQQSDGDIPLPGVALQAADDVGDTRALRALQGVTRRAVVVAIAARRDRGRIVAVQPDRGATLQVVRMAEEAQEGLGKIARAAGGTALPHQAHLHPLVVVDLLTARKMNDPQIRASLNPKRLRTTMRWVHPKKQRTAAQRS